MYFIHWLENKRTKAPGRTLAGVLAAGILFLAVAGEFHVSAATSLTPRFKVIFNNNPSFRGEEIHGSRVENEPSIRVEGARIPERGTLRIAVYGQRDKLLYSGKREIEPINGSFSAEIPLKAPLDGPLYTKLSYQNAKGSTSVKIPVTLHKIYGKVSDLSGKPIAAYLIVSWDNEPAIRARADRDGDFVIWLPEEVIGHIFVDDATYGKTTLESFIGHNFILRSDVQLDIRIDRMELYNLRSWATLSTFYLYFIPMSLPRLQDITLEGTREVWPTLMKEDVGVWLNDREVEILQFEELRDFVGPNNKAWRPAYVVALSLSSLLDAYQRGDPAVIRVRAKDKGVNSAGEAFLINPSVD